MRSNICLVLNANRRCIYKSLRLACGGRRYHLMHSLVGLAVEDIMEKFPFLTCKTPGKGWRGSRVKVITEEWLRNHPITVAPEWSLHG